MFTECSLNICRMFTECSLNVHWMFTKWFAYKIANEFLLNIYWMFAVWMFTECSAGAIDAVEAVEAW